MRPRAVNLIHQVELQAPLDLLAAHDAPLGKLLAQANLPDRLQEPEDGFLPARHLLPMRTYGTRMPSGRCSQRS